MSSRLARRGLRPMIPLLASVLVLAVSGTTATAQGQSPSGPPASPVDDDTLRMVVLGDSIPFTGFCGECTVGFADLYADELEARAGRPVEVINRSRDDSAGMAQIKTQVTEERLLRDQIAAADVVLVSVGYNNVMPDASTGVGCLGDMGDSIESYLTWLLETTPECRQAGRDVYAADYDTIFSTIRELRGGAPTVLAALNVHDGNKGNPEITAAKVSADVLADVDALLPDIYDAWNTMLCDRAVQGGFACVDVYHAFNGPTGNEPSTAWTVDGAHPSPAGIDLIAGLLAELDISPITE
jgi:hypothetical protein